SRAESQLCRRHANIALSARRVLSRFERHLRAAAQLSLYYFAESEVGRLGVSAKFANLTVAPSLPPTVSATRTLRSHGGRCLPSTSCPIGFQGCDSSPRTKNEKRCPSLA